MQSKFQFHPGELIVQKLAGEVDVAERNSKLISETILGGAIPFIEKQFMVVLASIDNKGSAWSSIIYGKPGFVYASSEDYVQINLTERDVSDPFWSNISCNPEIGMLFIDLGSRRRYRINGVVEKIEEGGGFSMAVREAFPNCPRYIQKRQLQNIGDKFATEDVVHGVLINDKVESIILNADTLFVATANPQSGADASHRGGEPGFVQIIKSNTIRIPDFNGNSLFNTLGNIETNPYTGICIPDFQGQKLLQLTGKAQTLWNQDDPYNLTGGTKRFLAFEIDSWILRHVPQYLEWELLETSPFNPKQNMI